MTSPLLVADLFCGAGGSSTGAERALKALGLEMTLVCVNHWPVAIETHKRNHPTARHYVQDVTVADPEHLVPEGYLDLLMASPECRYHSQARGGKPINDQQRMDPWAVIRWLTSLDVRCLLVENVPEFTGWGPLTRESRPDKTKRGLYFEEWVRVIQGLGYTTEWKTLNAANYGDATTRTRFFLQARKDGRPIVWPEPSHAQAGKDALFGNRERWRAAREIIDWSNPGRSLLDDKRYIDRPLSEKTRKRIARGLERFGGALAPLYIRLLGLEATASSAGEAHPFVMGKQGQDPAYRDIDEPVMTLTTDGKPVLLQPIVEPLVGANRNNNLLRDLDQPVPPATTAPGGGLYMVEPQLEAFVLGQQSGSAPRATNEPIPTVAADGAIALVEPLIIPYYRTGVADSATEPLATVTTKGRFGLASALVVPYGPKAEARSEDEPLPTVLTKDRLGLASFVLSRHGNDLQREVEAPLPTATGRGAGYLVQPFIVPQFSERDGQSPRVHAVDEPIPAVTSHGAGRIVEPVLIGTDQTGGNGSYTRSVDGPLGTIVTKQNMAICDPCLVQVNDSSEAEHGRVRSIEDPLWTVTTHRNVALIEAVLDQVREGKLDPRRLVIIDDVPYQLDLRFRMLNNRELSRAMSFDDEEATYEFVGNVGEVTKQIGNAVPVRTSSALVKAVLG